MRIYTQDDYHEAYRYFKAIVDAYPNRQWKDYYEDCSTKEALLARYEFMKSVYQKELSAIDATREIWTKYPNLHPCNILDDVLSLGGFIIKM